LEVIDRGLLIGNHVVLFSEYPTGSLFHIVTSGVLFGLKAEVREEGFLVYSRLMQNTIHQKKTLESSSPVFSLPFCMPISLFQHPQEVDHETVSYLKSSLNVYDLEISE